MNLITDLLSYALSAQNPCGCSSDEKEGRKGIDKSTGCTSQQVAIAETERTESSESRNQSFLQTDKSRAEIKHTVYKKGSVGK